MRIHSIFRSIDGEVNRYGQGTWCTFVRLQGCNLKCIFCDTVDSRNRRKGFSMDVLTVSKKVEEMGHKKVTITGGEPMMQAQHVYDLSRLLDGAGYQVTIETNGSLPLIGYHPSWVVDWKLANSDMSEHMDMDCFTGLREQDFVKFVVGPGVHISANSVFEEAVYIMHRLKSKGCDARFAFSPDLKHVHPKWLYSWMQDKMEKEKLHDCVLNVQLHKVFQLP
jgi:7-carboxy-7-deazaguanine synthase